MFRTNLNIVLLGMFLIGANLLIVSANTPEWTDAERAMEVTSSYPPEHFFGGPAYDEYNRQWHRDINALRTDKWPQYDFGTGLWSLAVTLLIGVRLLGIRNWRGVLGMTTPTSRLRILSFLTIAWIGWPLSLTATLYLDFHRGFFPPWADTLFIPLTGYFVAAILGYAFIMAIGAAALWRAKLPTKLWSWNAQAPIRSWLFTLPAALAVVLNLLGVYGTLAIGHWSCIPVFLCLSYAALVLRAAALSSIPHQALGK